MAGLTAAYVLAKSGFKTLVLERADHCGEKNVSGGIFYGDSFHKVFSEVSSEAPIERYIKRKILSCVSGHSVVSYDYCNGDEGYNIGFSILRAKFDRWLGEKVIEAGAEIICGVTVDNLVVDGGVVKGISVGDEKLYSNVVILAEGANAVLTEKANLRNRLKPYQVGVGVKEIIKLNEKDIDERFNLDPGEGVAIELFGTITEQIEGGGFIYTNRESLSLGLVFTLSSYKQGNAPPYEILERFKSIPYVNRLVRGGEGVEYSAHLVPETGVEMSPDVYGNGVLVVGDAAGFAIKNGRTVEGMNYAVESGRLAAETIIEAVQFGDYSAETLCKYQNKIMDNDLFKHFQKLDKSYQFFQNPRLYKEYPKLIGNFSKMLFNAGDRSDSRISGLLFQSTKSSEVTIANLVSDVIRTQRWL